MIGGGGKEEDNEEEAETIREVRERERERERTKEGLWRRKQGAPGRLAPRWSQAASFEERPLEPGATADRASSKRT
jgi:hypothetical protein